MVLRSDATLHDIPLRDAGTPTYVGLPLDRYVSLFEMLNPMHRLWSSGRWNKLTIAHGCYWKKCSFCDITLDYIARYDLAAADLLVDRIEALIAETGQSGFHFVDEAAPPAAAARAGRAAHRAQRRLSLGGATFASSRPSRPKAGRAARALGLRRGLRRARGRHRRLLAARSPRAHGGAGGKVTRRSPTAAS